MRINSNRTPYLELRLCLAIIISLVFIVADNRLCMFLSFKQYIEKNSVYFFYFLHDKPCCIFEYISKILYGYKTLVLENNALIQELFLKNHELLLLDQYKKENHILRTLLNFSYYNNTEKIIAKVVLTSMGCNSPNIVINRGFEHGVFVGQPVMTDTGIVGQIISVNKFNSYILLICDPTYSLSVQVQRSNVRMILMGRGYNMNLCAECSEESDVCVGDMLVTSGLDGLFPEGYPVAVVTQVSMNTEKDQIIIQAKPIVKFQFLRYVVLVWE